MRECRAAWRSTAPGAWVWHVALSWGTNGLAQFTNGNWFCGACRGVLRGGLRLRHARLLDPSNLKRIMPTKETAGVVKHALGRTAPLHSGVRFGSGVSNHE